VSLGNGDGTFQTPFSLYDPNLGIPFDIVVSDFNGDGLADIAIGDTGNEYVVIFTGNGNGTFQDAGIWAPQYPMVYLLAADIHGQKAKSGLADLVYTSGSDLGFMINETK
jgi:hypothetical protein